MNLLIIKNLDYIRLEIRLLEQITLLNNKFSLFLNFINE